MQFADGPPQGELAPSALAKRSESTALGQRTTRSGERGGNGQAAANQYPALKGLLIRSASGDTSNNLSVGIFSPASVNALISATTFVVGSVLLASFARSAWLVCAERATEKNRST